MKGVAQGLGSIRGKLAASPRARILFWAALISSLAGLIGLGEPLDQQIQIVRNFIRSRPADGSIVVVEVNNRTQRAVDALGAHRAVDAKALERLFQLGAKRVFFDKVYTDPSPLGEDSVLARVMAEHPGRVFLGARFEQNRRTGVREPLLPVEPLRRVAGLGSINAWHDYMGYTSRVPLSSRIGTDTYPSFSVLLSGTHLSGEEMFTPDFAIRYETVPTINLLDVLDKSSPRTALLAGRDVIVAPTADSLGDTHVVPAQGPIPGVYVHVIGAQTLKEGMPWQLGWLPPALLALLIGVAYVYAVRRTMRTVVGLASAVALFAGPIALESWGANVEIVPALILLAIIGVRARILSRRLSNPLTGLPTLDSILQDASTSPRTLIGMRLGNHADLRATLNDEENGVLVTEIVRRLRVGGDLHELMHSGDSFIWKTGLDVGPHLFDHLQGLHALLSLPVNVAGRPVDLKIAFGIEDGRDRPLTNRVGSLQISTEEALASGAKWRLFDPRQLDDAEFRHSLLSRLDLAIENGEMWVAYQPKLNLKNKRVTGAEALVRWSHPERGLIPPNDFIPVAEQANRIAGLTFFVMETAIRDLVRLDSIAPDFTVAVNLSVRMLSHADLVDRIAMLLSQHGLSPGRLTLEITEGEEIDPASGDLAMLHALRALGVHLSIDDYGTKFSTLDYVRQLPASEIKIDQRFIGDIHHDRQARILAQSTIELAHSLGLTVVAEGVELPVTLTALTEMNCDLAQGYLIGRPITFAELHRFVAQTRLRRVA